MTFPVHPYAQAPQQQVAAPPREVDPNNPGSVAADVLARISAYDSTAPKVDADVVRRWAEIIRAAGVEYPWLLEGIIRVYSTGGEPPQMKLAAVLDAARTARRESRKGEAIKELGPAPSFDDDAPGAGHVGYALPDAYNTDHAIDLDCPTCGAPGLRHDEDGEVLAGEWCEQELQGNREIKKIPCTGRLSLAYRTNNPKGRARHKARQEHLAHHRRTYQPTWTN